MAVQIKTVITNNNRNNFVAAGGHGKRITVRGGETITLPYDLFSVIGKSEQDVYTRATTKGIITLKTSVITPENVLTVTSDGNVDIRIAQEAPQKEVKVLQAKAPVKEPAKDVSMGISGIVAGASAKDMEKYGATAESVAAKKVKDVHVVNGKIIPDDPAQEKAAKEFAEKEASIYTPGTGIGMVNQKQDIKADTENVFSAEVPKAEEPEKEAETEPSMEDAVNGYIRDKDYNMLYAYLADHYPNIFSKVTKTQVKKCKSWKEIMQLLGI